MTTRNDPAASGSAHLTEAPVFLVVFFAVASGFFTYAGMTESVAHNRGVAMGMAAFFGLLALVAMINAITDRIVKAIEANKPAA